ncbi:MAG: CHAP domain-containing protein [Acutalibacteraceae bacterium]|nr:CHAP domain-containing protein [Acutalibacteraceae bacterium]
MTDREKFLQQAKTYIGQTGYGVCILKLHLGFVCDWCAYSVSSIMQDCGFIGKYIKEVEGGAGTIPRYSDGKYGTWFKKGAKVPQAGDLFFLRYADYPYQDKYFCDHVGIVESVSGNTLTTLEGNVDGCGSDWAGTSAFKRKCRYLSDNTVYAFYRPNWQGEDKPDKNANIDAIYQVHTLSGGKWLPDVTNPADFAGTENAKIDGVLASVSEGYIMYRVHLIGGGWLPWVCGRDDYAGDYGTAIDAIQMAYFGRNGYAVEYRVSTVNSNGYLPWVRDWDDGSEDGYAGILGSGVDKLQVRIVAIQK